MTSILDLPNELAAILGGCLSASDLGSLRGSCLALAVQYTYLQGPYLNVPVTLDPKGYSTLRCLLRPPRRLAPMAPWIRRISFVDRGLAKIARTWCICDEDVYRRVKRTGRTRLVHEHGRVRYPGFKQNATIWLPESKAALCCSEVSERNVEAIAALLEQFPRLDCISTVLHRHEVDILYDPAATTTAADFEVMKDVKLKPSSIEDWKHKFDFAGPCRVETHLVRYEQDSTERRVSGHILGLVTWISCAWSLDWSRSLDCSVA